MSEVELRQKCDCTPLGTEALKAVDAMRSLGFSQTIKCTLTAEEVASQLDFGSYPIVFVNLLPIDGIKCSHAMVVVEMNSEIVEVCDPLKGERILPRSTFDTAWAMMCNLVILLRE